MKDVHFTWLHLTDFHLNVNNNCWLDIEDSFFRDLDHFKCNPWDLILITGDLAQRGRAEEFERFMEILEDILSKFKELDLHPKILIVPGEHDLSRPKEHLDQKEDDHAVVEALGNIANNPKIEEELYNPESRYYRIIDQSFYNYNNFKRCLSNSHGVSNLNYGIFPGDFSVTIQKGGAKLGIVGLNTAFIQLANGDYKGRLILPKLQFHKACGGKVSKWAKDHHACLLMTHHPLEWLDERAMRSFEEYIGEYFAIHLCGHVHDANLRDLSDRRKPPIWTSSCHSLLGAELKEEETSCGYTIGRIVFFDQDTRANFVLWPRYRNCGMFTSDSKFTLEGNEHTERYIKLKKRFEIKPERSTPESRPEQGRCPGINMNDNNPQDEEDKKITNEERIENCSNNREQYFGLFFKIYSFINELILYILSYKINYLGKSVQTIGEVKSNRNIPSSLPQLTLKEED